MAGKITTNSVVLGDSVTDTQNFVLKTNADGTATLARGALGGLGTVFGVNGSGALTGATLVAPALGTPASGVLTNCTGVPASALPAGSVLQVVNATYIPAVSASTSQVTLLELAITPRSSSSKIMIFYSLGMMDNITSADCQLRVRRGGSAGTIIPNYTSTVTSYFYCAARIQVPQSGTFIDSPSTTSSTTYGVYIQTSTATCSVNGTTLILMEIQG